MDSLQGSSEPGQDLQTPEEQAIALFEAGQFLETLDTDIQGEELEESENPFESPDVEPPISTEVISGLEEDLAENDSLPYSGNGEYLLLSELEEHSAIPEVGLDNHGVIGGMDVYQDKNNIVIEYRIPDGTLGPNNVNHPEDALEARRDQMTDGLTPIEGVSVETNYDFEKGELVAKLSYPEERKEEGVTKVAAAIAEFESDYSGR